MLSLTRDRLAELTGGEVQGELKTSFNGVEFDSRNIKGGELFVALQGESVHGHVFVPQALERGAALCLIEDSRVKKQVNEPERLIVVKDSLQSFWSLASHWRQELTLPVLGITGSVGKTTIKEICAGILLKHALGTYALKSHNNHVGVPYTLCRISRQHKWAVLEMGMNHAGELSKLSQMAKPDVVAITQVAAAHMGAFNNIEEIAQAKCEIVEGLKSDGSFIVNADDPVLMKYIEAKKPHGSRKLYTFGGKSSCDARVSNVKSAGIKGISFDLELFGKSFPIKMGVIGTHNAINSACAALSVKLLMPEIAEEKIATDLAQVQAAHMRLNVYQLAEERFLIDDSYNANPASMRAALELLRQMQQQKKRVALIVGDMLELGQFSERYHKEIGREIAALKPAFLIALGEYSDYVLQDSAAQGTKAFKAESAQQAVDIAGSEEFDVLLVKASRGMRLEKVVEMLRGER